MRGAFDYTSVYPSVIRRGISDESQEIPISARFSKTKPIIVERFKRRPMRKRFSSVVSMSFVILLAAVTTIRIYGC